MTNDNHDTRRYGVFRNAVGAKGAFKVFERILFILRRYGFSPNKIDQALKQYVEIHSIHDSSATFPTPALVVERYPHIIQKYQAEGIEFAVHGLKHIDYSQLSYDEQMNDLVEAKKIFSQAGIDCSGFRTPYLRRDNSLDKAIGDAGLSYSSNQPVIWEAIDLESLDDGDRNSYTRGLDFYDSWSSNERISCPSLKAGVVHIPVSLPDDEMLVDRIGFQDNEILTNAWRYILHQTYQRGELFALQLHPERIELCADSLAAILDEASGLNPKVWFATLGEIDQWWRKRLETRISVTDLRDGNYSVSVIGAREVSILINHVEPGELGDTSWEDYIRVDKKEFTLQAKYWPGIGLSEQLFETWSDFLNQQGYLGEQINNEKNYACRLEQAAMATWDEFSILQYIRKTEKPLVRKNLWPNGARSALSVTGDLDALTLWDFGLRIFGK